MTTKLLGGALLIAGLCTLTTACSKEDVQAAGDKAGAMADQAGDKAGAMAETATAKASELKDQFSAWMKEQQGVLDDKLAELRDGTSGLSGDAAEAKQKTVATLEQRVADIKAMLAEWKDVSAEKWAEWSAKARERVAALRADIQDAIDGNG